MRLFFWSLLVMLLAGCANDAPSLVATPQEFTGQLQQHNWQKSIESYCAGGSEYFTLQQSDGTDLVLTTPNDLGAWQKFIGQQVSVKALVKEKVIMPPNEQSQQPVNWQQTPNAAPAESQTEPAAFRCQVLVVKHIDLLN